MWLSILFESKLMNSSPITVAIPTYNRVTSVTNLIHKLIPQLNQEDEILVIDDASQDGTSEFISKIPQVRLITNSINIGMVKNWNKCLTSASHDWVCIIHDDDTITPTTIQTIKRATTLINEPIIIRHDNLDTEIDQCFRYRVLEPGAWAVLNDSFIPSGVTIHKAIIESIGLFNEKFDYSPDIEYFARICAKYCSVIIESPKILSFNLHSQNYEYKTWAKPDFLTQLEEIEKLRLSYSGLQENIALKRFRNSMNGHIGHMLNSSSKADNPLLLKQVGLMVRNKRYLHRRNLVNAYIASLFNWYPRMYVKY